MKKRKLGNTDIKLTSIGFGGAPIGNLFEELDEPTCYDILQHSYKSNINIFDTSPLYGYGLSEHRIGNFLKTIDPEEIPYNLTDFYYTNIFIKQNSVKKIKFK